MTQVFPLIEETAEPGWGLAMPQPDFLSGPSVEEMATELESPAASLGYNSSFMTVRGAVMALNPPEDAAIVSHPTTGDTSVPHTFMALPRTTFSLRGELMHTFVSYRVATEGDAGNGMSGLLADKIRAFSMDRTQELQLPQHGWGIWPKGLKKAVPFRKEEAKVFLDRDCLQDGQSWLTGFVQGSTPKPTILTPTPKPQTLCHGQHPAACGLASAP